MHPPNSTRAQHGLSKSSFVQSWNGRRAFAAAKQSIGRPSAKWSTEDRRKIDVTNINSLLKEREDVFMQSRRKLHSEIIFLHKNNKYMHCYESPDDRVNWDNLTHSVEK